MALQTQVNLDCAAAVPGDRASKNPFVYPPETPISGDAVICGNFAWLDTDGKTAQGTGTGAPLGIVERVIDKYDWDIRSVGTLQIMPKCALHIVLRGDLWVKTLTDATVGQSVFANTADGSIVTDAAGATVAGAEETPWLVKTAGLAGEMIKISNWEKGI